MNKLDLNKLKEKLDSALKNETNESLNSWLKEKRETIDEEQPKLEVVYDNTMINTSQVISYWKPTSVLRWKRVNIDKLRYNKVLQQMWQSSTGLQEWKDIPEED